MLLHLSSYSLNRRPWTACVEPVGQEHERGRIRMPNFQMRLRLVGAAVLIAMSWVPPALATDSVGGPASTIAQSDVPAALPEATADKFMPAENSHAVANAAPKAARVKKVARTRAATPKIAAPRPHANSRTAVRWSGPRSASFKVASTGCSASWLCPANLILGVGY
jgi:hypothetical protein